MSQSSAPKKIIFPLDDEAIRGLRAGDPVLITGTMLTARDAAHKRLYALLEQGRELPVDLKGQVIYYVGPAPAKPGYAVGPAGPTSSYRMDAYTPALLDLGLKGMIGKGARSAPVVEAIVRNRGVYFAAIGGGPDRQKHRQGGAALLRRPGHRGYPPVHGKGLSRHCGHRFPGK